MWALSLTASTVSKYFGQYLLVTCRSSLAVRSPGRVGDQIMSLSVAALVSVRESYACWPTYIHGGMRHADARGW